MNRLTILAASAVAAAGLTAGGVTAFATRDPGPNPAAEDFLPEHLHLENLPDRVGVVDEDGDIVGYVDRDLLLAKTRDLPVPEGMSVDGPFPVYDDAGTRIGTWTNNGGYIPTGAHGPGQSHSPVTSISIGDE